ncbi:MAG: hypothetical protein QG628_1033, partial [Patescibacteria group bacterium]|nr:hypothetical protein [Patescibacteria group bacterium]
LFRSPFGDFDTLDMPVGYGVEKNNGQWDCASQNGDRENQWFKLILRNDSKDKYYSGWSSGDYKYKGYDSKNLKDTKGDGKLYFINPDNAANFNLAGSKALDSASKAHTKINKQIDKSIERQEDGLDNKEKSAMLYASLADTFFNDNACDSSKVDHNDSGRKIKIGDTWYSLPGDDFATGDQEVFSVGYGKYGWDNTGKATCEAIAKKMDRHRADYISVTGDKGDVPKGTTSGTAGDPASTTNDVQSECTISANFITWIMCPLIEGFTLAVETLDTQITGLLNIDANQYFGDDETGQGFKEVWTSIRTISIGILVILALVMIISTAISMGPFDAYTVKKVMPRLLMVIVLIAISWPLVKFLIEMSNALGFAVRGLIQAPFVNQGVVKVDGGEATVAGVALLGGGFALGLPGLLSFLVTAFLAVMIAFLVLILRQILVVLLAVIAPIALVSFILPNTSKFGKFWWDSFSKALLAFPIISGFIAIGRVFASVAYSVGGPISGYIAFIAYFAPYFLIPQAFKMAGGILGNLSGMVNDRGRGAFDRLKNFRQGQTKKNWENTLNNRRFNPQGRLGGLNQTAQFGALAASGKAGIDPRRMAGRAAGEREARELNEAEHLIKDNDAVKAIFNDDHLLTAASTMRGRGNIEQFLRHQTGGRFASLDDAEMAQTVSAVEAAQKAGSSGAIEIVSAIGHAASGTGGSAVDLLAEAGSASHGSQNLRNRIIAAQNSAAGNARRGDFTAVGHTEKEDLARQLQEGTLTAQQVEERMLTRSLETSGAGALVNTREEPFRHMMTQLGNSYNEAINSGDTDRATELAAQITSFRSAMSYAPPENKAHISSMLAGVGLDPGAVNASTGAVMSIDEQLGVQLNDARMNDPAYVAGLEANYRRDNPGFVGPLSRENLRSYGQQVSGQRVRTRAGQYDAGGGNRTPEQIRASQGTNPDGSPR